MVVIADNETFVIKRLNLCSDDGSELRVIHVDGLVGEPGEQNSRNPKTSSFGHTMVPTLAVILVSAVCSVPVGIDRPHGVCGRMVWLLMRKIT